MKDISYFKTSDNERIRVKRFDGETFQIFSGNHPESYSQCQAFEMKVQIDKGNWIETTESEYNQ